jgi:SpoIID/LytB domain protein
MLVRSALLGFRLGLLLILAGWLLVSLATSVLAEHPVRPPVVTEDSGLRVLLRDRGDLDDPTTWSQLTLRMVCRGLLYCPDDRKGFNLDLPPGCRIQVQANQEAGLLIAAADLAADPLVWNVTRVRLIPHPELLPETSHASAALDDDRLELPDGGPVFTLGDRTYRGALDIIRPTWKRLYAINTLPLAAWIDGVLQTEGSPDWPLAALQAFAVVVRSIGIQHRQAAAAMETPGGSHLDDGRFAYDGTGHGGERIRAAVHSTRGQVLLYRGQPFEPCYHAASGGYLAGIAEVFPARVSAETRADLAGIMPAEADAAAYPAAQAFGQERYWEHETVIDAEALRRAIRRRYPDTGWIRRLACAGQLHGPTGAVRRVTAIQLEWYGGSRRLSGEEFRELLGDAALPSTLWSADSPREDRLGRNQAWRFICYGRGHGVGLSLISACQLATGPGALDYRLILGRFFRLAEVGDLTP